LVLVVSIVVVRREFSCGRRSRKNEEGFTPKVQQRQKKGRGKCERVVFFSVRIVFLSIFVWKLKEKKMAGRKETNCCCCQLFCRISDAGRKLLLDCLRPLF
jgi:SNF family Na+-dependent transporter